MVAATENFSGPLADSDKYVVHRDIPLFDEHIGEDGVHYTEQLLQRIADNNNERIDDTGDYVPIVEWHTKDDASPDEDPPVLGFAGPFYVAPFGNKRPRPCIYAKAMYIFRDKEDVWRKRPRRSVEMWPEDKPENRYFDPIALLGAETPKRDLGMALTYSKKNKSAGTRRIRYSMGSQATAPSGGNTFVPSTSNSRKRRRHEKDETMDQASQIIEGVGSMLEQLKQEFDARLGAVEEKVGLVDDPAAGAEEQLVTPGDGDPNAGPPLDDVQQPPVDDLSGGEPPMDMPPEEELPPLGEEDEEYATAMGKRFAKRYMMGADGPDMPGAEMYTKGLDPEDKKSLDQYMKYSCDDKDTKEFYAKACGRSADHYSKASPSLLRYRKQVNDLSEKYRKAQSEAQKYAKRAAIAEQRLADVNQELEDTQGIAARSKREVVLYQKSMAGYSFDLDDEIKRTAEMTDDEFDRHTATMDNYPRVPISDFKPVDREINGPIQHKKATELSAKYAKRAADVVQQHRKAGKDYDYQQVLKYMIARESGDFDEKEFNKAG